MDIIIWEAGLKKQHKKKENKCNKLIRRDKYLLEKQRDNLIKFILNIKRNLKIQFKKF